MLLSFPNNKGFKYNKKENKTNEIKKIVFFKKIFLN